MKIPNLISIIHVTRSISSTSMPWNDLHKYLQESPKISSKFIVVNSLFRSIVKKKDFEGNNYYEVGFFSLPIGIRRLTSKHIRKSTIIHCHNASLFSNTLIVSFTLGIKCIFNIHNDWRNFNTFQKLNIYLTAFFKKKMICVSRAVEQSLKNYSNIFSEENMSHIDNSIDSNYFDKNFPINDFFYNRKKRIVIIARMVPQKNTNLILKILDNIDSSWEVEWFGDGIEKEAILAHIKRNKPKCKININGIVPREDVFQVLYDSQIYLACSKWEGIGVANLEAGALGCIPILSNIPPHIDISKKTGAIICDNDNLNDWLDEILKITTNIEHGKKMSKEISSSTKRVYGRQEMINSYINLFYTLT